VASPDAALPPGADVCDVCGARGMQHCPGCDVDLCDARAEAHTCAKPHLRCPHGRPSHHLCPHCLGLSTGGRRMEFAHGATCPCVACVDVRARAIPAPTGEAGLTTTPARELAHATAAEALLAATARVAELTAVLRALAEVEPRRTECHGRRSYTRCSTCAAPPVSDPHRELRHEASCPWAQARALLAGREAEGGDHG
jgi:hypothetical protein